MCPENSDGKSQAFQQTLNRKYIESREFRLDENWLLNKWIACNQLIRIKYDNADFSTNSNFYSLFININIHLKAQSI